MTVCWGRDERKARELARAHWPTAGDGVVAVQGAAAALDFEAVAELVTADAVAETVTCGPDPRRHLEAIERYARAGYDHVCVYQVGPDQEGFIDFFARAILPALGGRAARGKRQWPRAGRAQPRRAWQRQPRRASQWHAPEGNNGSRAVRGNGRRRPAARRRAKACA
jgi:hypothetical protein